MYNEIFETNKNIQTKKIALISDIHYSYPGYNLNFFYKIIKQIQENKPDYICIVGDILDDAKYTKLNELKNFFTELANIATVLVVIGNHDEKKGGLHSWEHYENEELILMMKQINNLHYLDDSIYIDKSICFYGFKLSYHHYEVANESYDSFVSEAYKLKTKLNEDNYNIILFHSPINIYRFIRNNDNHELNKADLILSGHMHNGIIPFCITHFFNKAFGTSRSLIAPSLSLFPKYAQGRIEDIKDGFVYEGVSKLSKSTGFLHIFNNLYNTNVMFITIKKR